MTCEVSWFAALCDDDYEQLGVVDPARLSSWEHCGAIVAEAEARGFDNVLLPSGYALGIDAVAFAGGIAARTDRIRLLVAMRCGELWVPQMARQIATLDRMAGGRLTVNIISSEMPGEVLDGPARYRRTAETMAVLRTLLDGRPVHADGEFVRVDLEPPRITTVSGRCPPLYFGGLSEGAREVAAAHADVYLMWPDTLDRVAEVIADVTARAARHGRRLRFGYRVHVVVRPTEAEARAAAAHIVAALDDATGAAIRARSLDSASTGVRRQAELRGGAADDGFVEEHLWTGIGRGRSGCGAAIVGDPDQVVAKLEAYRALGIDAFILSGYPHLEECRRVGEWVLPRLAHGPLPVTPGYTDGSSP
ncbi:MAG: LLM class flavin-dependent oxidoreductase [Actinobacteria bacterium]|nr:LLM class flavin-dependent oxidoreductase [Actinomycetota bacterium]